MREGSGRRGHLRDGDRRPLRSDEGVLRGDTRAKPHGLMADRIQNIITRVDNILQATFILIEA